MVAHKPLLPQELDSIRAAVSADPRAVLPLGMIECLLATVDHRGNQLTEAARELPGCSGPVAERTQVYRRAHAQEVDLLRAFQEDVRRELLDPLAACECRHGAAVEPLSDEERAEILRIVSQASVKLKFREIAGAIPAKVKSR